MIEVCLPVKKKEPPFVVDPEGDTARQQKPPRSRRFFPLFPRIREKVAPLFLFSSSRESGSTQAPERQERALPLFSGR